MPRRLVNVALLVAVPLLVTTGLLSWVASEPVAGSLLVAHRVAGVAIILGLAWKYGIARRSFARRLHARADAGLAVAGLASTALLLSLGLGLAWTAGVVSFDRPIEYSALNLHVFVGLALLPLALAHAALRWERRPSLAASVDRRAAVRLLAIGGAAALATAALDRVALVRRWTGSRHAASFSGNAFPLTIWAFDDIPLIDAASWRLRIGGAVSVPRSLSLMELLALPVTERDALLDCTGGWWSEQRWRGVTIAHLLAGAGLDPSASRVEVISVTGHAWSFPLAEAGALLLATHVGGETLSAGHGYPARLVAPGRRGFQWIKWIERLEVA